jgi:hypothetical protein
VTAPAKASSQALVRCPLCLEQYVLSEALAEAPPMLLVVGDDLGAEASRDGASAIEEYQLADRGFTPVGNSHAAVGGVAAPGRIALRSAARPKKKEKNALWEVIQVIFGGVLALPLAVLFLWWVVGRDDFELGPKVARYAAWIVPGRFEGRAQVNESAMGRPDQTVVKSNATTNAPTKERRKPIREPDLPVVSRRPPIEEEGTEKSVEQPGAVETSLPMPNLLDLLPDDFGSKDKKPAKENGR